MNQGVFGMMGPREASCESFWRGNLASGVRGIIDPFDPSNPYGPGLTTTETMKGHAKTGSGVTGMTADTSGVGSQVVDLSRVSGIMSNSRFEYDNLDTSLDEVNPLFNSTALSPFGSILMYRESQEEHFEVPPNSQKLLYDEATEALEYSVKGVKLDSATSLKSHVNSWGLSSNNWLADNVLPNCNNLKILDFSDTINMQHRSDLCMGIKSLLLACADKPIRKINLSDNFLD